MGRIRAYAKNCPEYLGFLIQAVHITDNLELVRTPTASITILGAPGAVRSVS